MNEANVLTEIRERLVRLETKIDTISETKETASTAKTIAVEALQSTKSAHHRLDKIEDNQRWIWRAIGGAIISGLFAWFWKGYGGG